MIPFLSACFTELRAKGVCARNKRTGDAGGREEEFDLHTEEEKLDHKNLALWKWARPTSPTLIPTVSHSTPCARSTSLLIERGAGGLPRCCRKRGREQGSVAHTAVQSRTRAQPCARKHMPDERQPKGRLGGSHLGSVPQGPSGGCVSRLQCSLRWEKMCPTSSRGVRSQYRVFPLTRMRSSGRNYCWCAVQYADIKKCCCCCCCSSLGRSFRCLFL